MTDKIAVIGGGITGLFTTLYLANAGFNVHLYERGDIASGTSGHFHGMLHSGARYAVNDEISARECANENRIIFEMASDFVDDTGGYFVALNGEEAEYGSILSRRCNAIGILSEEIQPEEFLKLEPFVNPSVQKVLRVPDRIIHSYEFSVAVALEAMMNGASISTNSNVEKINVEAGSVKGITVSDINGTRRESFDYVVNATGPYSSGLLSRSGVETPPLMPAVGSMAVYNGRFVNSVINRMRKPSDGDIFLPYGEVSILGTLATVVDNPEEFEVDSEDIEMMVEEGNEMIPALGGMKYSRIYSSIRPLVDDSSKSAREATRSFRIIEHTEDGLDGLVSLVGGKFTTGRLIGEQTADYVAGKFGNRDRSKKKVDLNSTYERFSRSGKCRYPELLKMLGDKRGTIDEERLNPALSLIFAASICID